MNSGQRIDDGSGFDIHRCQGAVVRRNHDCGREIGRGLGRVPGIRHQAGTLHAVNKRARRSLMLVLTFGVPLNIEQPSTSRG